MAKSKIIYNPHLTIAENAHNNKVTESAIRRYIRINKIDRKGDNALILRSSIKELRKKNPDISIAEICRTLNLSKNTVKKYLDADIKGSEIDTVKVSMFDQSKRRFIISSVSKTVYFLDFDGTIANTYALKQGKDWKDSQQYIPQIGIYPRAIQFIEEEQRKGNEVYIVSGNVGSTIIKALEYFNIPIPKECVYGYRFGYPTENLRRKIRVIQEALKTVEDKSKVVYIGDEIDDFKACREVGIKFESEMFSTY